jgi:hypothetical protein
MDEQIIQEAEKEQSDRRVEFQQIIERWLYQMHLAGISVASNAVEVRVSYQTVSVGSATHSFKSPAIAAAIARYSLLRQGCRYLCSCTI